MMIIGNYATMKIRQILRAETRVADEQNPVGNPNLCKDRKAMALWRQTMDPAVWVWRGEGQVILHNDSAAITWEES